MSFILVVSITLRLVALGWSVVLLRRIRDWRMGFLAVMLGLMALRQTLALLATSTSWELTLSGLGSEWPGLIVSVMAFLAIFFLERILTDRSRAEAEIKLLAEALRSTGEAVSITDSKDTIIFVNQAFLKTYGYEKDEIIGQPITCLRAPDHPAAEDPVAVPLNERGTWQGELWNRKKDGTVFPILLSTAMVRDEGGQPTAFIGVAADITKRKRAEEALHENEERNRLLLETAFEGIVISEKGRILEANLPFAAMYGYDLDEVIGLSPLDMTTPESAERIMDHIARGIEKPYEIVGLKKDGSSFDLEVVGKNCTYQGRPARIVAMRDITERKKAAEALQASEARFQSLLHALNDVVWTASVDDATMLYMNAATERIYGRPLTAFTENSNLWLEVVHPDDQERVRAESVLLFEQGHVEQEYRIVRPDGTVRWLSDRKYMTFDEAGSPLQIGGIATDITQRKQAEEQEIHLGRILEESLNEIYIFDAETLRFVQVNRGARKNTGYSLDELRTLTPLDLKPEFTPETFAQLVEPLRTGAQEQIDFTTMHRRKDGSLYPVEIHLQLSLWEQSTVFVATILDITERKQTEETIRKNQNLLSLALRTAHAGAWEWNVKTNQATWSNENYMVLGLTPGSCEASYETWLRCVHPDDRETAQQKVAIALEERKDLNLDYRIVWPDGTVRWINDKGKLLLDDQGEPAHMYGFQIDITERKHAEEALQITEQHNRALLDGIPDMMFRLHRDGTFLDYKAEATEELAVPSEAIIGSTLDQMPMPAQFVEDLMRCIQHAITTGEVQTYVYELAVPVGVQTYEARIVRSGVDEVVCIIRNVTARKRAEEELRASEEKYRVLIDHAPYCIHQIDTQGRLFSMNPAGLKMMGTEAEENIKGLPYLDMIAEKDRPCIERLLQAALQGEASAFEFEATNGHVFASSFIPIFNDEGTVIRLMGISRDISERKRAEAERERLIDELEARNAELERFTYTVSHDLKTPLVTINGFLGLLLRDAKAGNQEALERDAAHISNAADRMAQLLSELLDLSRIGRVVNPSEEVPLTELAHEALNLVADQVTKRGVAVTINPDLPVVFGDRVRLLEVLQNLIDNAVKFMGDEPAPRLEIGYRNDSPDVVCYVQDNGIGIAPRHHEQIFGLFNRLALNVEGTGIGLALVKRIVEMHGGRIWVESEGEGQGSTFCFMLPH